ncbi:hypothetical protein BD779DRAFT_594278 [Infundibulicybe gibba]|nr:hypothetical protein BD779DRAFT_594278 [Infundibulicybe gibba]
MLFHGAIQRPWEFCEQESETRGCGSQGEPRSYETGRNFKGGRYVSPCAQSAWDWFDIDDKRGLVIDLSRPSFAHCHEWAEPLQMTFGDEIFPALQPGSKMMWCRQKADCEQRGAVLARSLVGCRFVYIVRARWPVPGGLGHLSLDSSGGEKTNSGSSNSLTKNETILLAASPQTPLWIMAMGGITHSTGRSDSNGIISMCVGNHHTSIWGP